MRPPEYFKEQRIELPARHPCPIDRRHRPQRRAGDGTRRPFGALLIATGADPVRPPIPGADGPQVHYLRSFADSRAIIARTASPSMSWSSARASSGSKWRPRSANARHRRRRGRAGARAARADHGPGIGRSSRPCTSRRASPSTWDNRDPDRRRTVTLGDGTTLDADFVVMGVGVRPARLWPKARASRSTAASSVNECSRPACQAYSRPATSRGGRPALGRARPHRALGGGGASGPGRRAGDAGHRERFDRFPSSGASTTTSPSDTSAMPSAGTA